MAFGLDLVWQVLPVVVASVAPYVTEVVKKGVAYAGAAVPAKLKPFINVLVAALLGGLAGDPATGVAVGIGTSAAFAVGKRS